MRAIDKIKATVVSLIRQGVSPKELSFSLALGVSVGICPFFGITTALCAFLAYRFRLNLVMIQLANWISGPLELMLLPVYIRLGEWMTGASPVPFSPAEIVRLAQADFIGFALQGWKTVLLALLAWGATLPALVLALYAAMLPLGKRGCRKWQRPIQT